MASLYGQGALLDPVLEPTRGGFMQSQVKKFVFAASVAGMLSITAPAIAVPLTDGPDCGFWARAKGFIVHVLDVVENKLTIPPG